MWQLIKFLVPLFYGAVHQAVKERDWAFRKGLRSLASHGGGMVSASIMEALAGKDSGAETAAINSLDTTFTHHGKLPPLASGHRHSRVSVAADGRD